MSMYKYSTEQIIAKLTSEQVADILSGFGTNVYKEDENHMWFRTVCHGGDSHKLCFFKDTKSFHCYTNCGTISIFTLVMQVLGCTFAQSLAYVAKEIGLDTRRGFFRSQKQDTGYLQASNYAAMRNKSKEKIILPTYDPHILNYFEDQYFKGWIEEGIGIDVMRLFGIKWYESEKHIIIPHYNIDGNLVGIRRRSLQEKDIHNKYMPERIEGKTYGHALGLNLYGLYENKKAIQKRKSAIIVESEKSVLLDRTFYGDNGTAVATCGFTVSNCQRNLLLEMGIEEVIIAFDNDFIADDYIGVDVEDVEYKKYVRYTQRLQRIADKFTPYCRTYILKDKKKLLQKKDSPYDRGQTVFEQILRDKKETKIKQVV